VIVSSENAVVGAGLTELDNFGNPGTPGRQFEFDVRGVGEPDLAGAIANDDYIELTFTTLPSFTSDLAFLDAIFHGTQNTGGGANNFTNYDFAVIASDDGFATPLSGSTSSMTKAPATQALTAMWTKSDGSLSMIHSSS